MDIATMNPDEKVDDPARKETQEFDPALLDEDGIHPEVAQDDEQDREHIESWHPFKTQ